VPHGWAGLLLRVPHSRFLRVGFWSCFGVYQSVTYPNGVAHSYSYDTKNRLTTMGAVGGSGANAANFSYAYTLDNAGHRTSVTEQSGRKVNYAYDNIYRLTAETIAGDPGGNNGSIGYTYDPVGNRTQQTSTIPAITSGGFGFDADDRLAGDVYDANGNTVNSGGIGNVYDFENHLIQQGGTTMVYDGNGNRVSKTVAGLTTNFLISEINPTGYAQVVSESFSGGTGNREESHAYVYGLDRISQNRLAFINSQNITQISYYVYDGHGSVRALTDPNGNVTDTYDYDAFGNEIHTTTTLASPTPNEFLFAGEQFDSDLHLYYNRALAPTCDRIKLRRVSWHSFRHTNATLLGEVGESIKTAQAILGHSDLETTLNTYMHAIPDSQRRAVGPVAGVLFPDVPKSGPVSEETGRIH
jgi:YD repeat-containing protein